MVFFRWSGRPPETSPSHWSLCQDLQRQKVTTLLCCLVCRRTAVMKEELATIPTTEMKHTVQGRRTAGFSAEKVVNRKCPITCSRPYILVSRKNNSNFGQNAEHCHYHIRYYIMISTFTSQISMYTPSTEWSMLLSVKHCVMDFSGGADDPRNLFCLKENINLFASGNVPALIQC